MNRRRISDEDRRRLCDAFESDNGNYLELARQLGINERSARSIIRIFREEGRIFRLRTGGAHNIKFDEEMREATAQIVEAEPFINLSNLNRKLQQQLGDKPHVSISTVARHLDGMLISLKIAGKDADIPMQRNSLRAINSRNEYANFFTNLGGFDHIVYLDETGFNIYTRPTQGRARIGERVRRVTLPRGPNITATLAISADMGLVHHRIVAATTTRENFQQFINELSEICINVFPENENVYIIFDGARPHLNVAPPVQFQNRLFCRILPCYSPFLNPTELAHSAFKGQIRAYLSDPAYRTRLGNDEERNRNGLSISQWRRQILTEIAQISLNAITVQKCQNWCGRVYRYMNMCLNNENIFD